MKKILLIQTFFLCYYLSVAQSNGSALPKGTYYKDGKVKITDDYEIVNTNGGLNATVRKKEKQMVKRLEPLNVVARLHRLLLAQSISQMILSLA
ncbi:MAG: hypothetical protein IPJ09_12860 [Saprospiraceae bacterium]|nr:hypothetical protein [Saprospiraceae bacterium]